MVCESVLAYTISTCIDGRSISNCKGFRQSEEFTLYHNYDICAGKNVESISDELILLIQIFSDIFLIF